MKKVSLLFGLIVMMFVAMPMSAQTYKDKKAAKKEAWEQDQQQKAEEDDLLHKMRMDSIRQAAQRAEAQRLKEEQEEAMREVEVAVPCCGEEFFSTPTLIRASGNGQSMNQQVAKNMARSSAIQELTSKVKVSVEALVGNYYKSENINMTENFMQKFQEMTVQKIKEEISGYRTICEKYTKFMNNGRPAFKCYMAIEIGKDDLLKPVFETLTNDQSAQIDMDYETFKAEFDKEFAE